LYAAPSKSFYKDNIVAKNGEIWITLNIEDNPNEIAEGDDVSDSE